MKYFIIGILAAYALAVGLCVYYADPVKPLPVPKTKTYTVDSHAIGELKGAIVMGFGSMFAIQGYTFDGYKTESFNYCRHVDYWGNPKTGDFVKLYKNEWDDCLIEKIELLEVK